MNRHFIGCLSLLSTYFLLSTPHSLYAFQGITDTQIILSKDLEIESFHNDNPDLILGNVTSIRVTDSNNIYVLDSMQNTIWAFDEAGNLINKIGRKGRGPGEFESPTSMVLVQDSLLAVLDPNQLRISLFNPVNFEKPYVNTYNLNKEAAVKRFGAHPIKIHYDSDADNLLLEYTIPFSPGASKEPKERTFFEFNNKKSNSSPILKIPENEYLVEDFDGVLTMMMMPFGGISKAEVSKGKVYYGWTTEPKISINDLHGKYLTEYKLHNPTVKITKKDIKDQKLSDFELNYIDKLPKMWPAFNWFVVDDKSRVWVATNTDDREHYVLSILDDKGQLIGQSTAPKSIELFVIRGKYAYGLNRSKDDGHSLIRYKIDGLED